MFVKIRFWSFCNWEEGCGERSDFEGGGDVGGDVLGVFGADGEADEAVGDADGGALGGGEGAVGVRGIVTI